VEGEFIALLEALKAMNQRGYSHVIFEMDSKNVMDMQFIIFVADVLNLVYSLVISIIFYLVIKTSWLSL
jgi:hypothetical protein